MAKRSLVNHATIREATKRAVHSWLVQTGRIEAPTDVDATKTFASYGLDIPEVHELSNHIIGAVKTQTGINFQLKPDQLRKLGRGTLQDYIEGATVQMMDALPGKPSTPSSGPVDDD